MDDQTASKRPHLATLHVWVEDEKGRPLHGLRHDDFEVFEDSERREIAVFVEEKADAATPSSIVIAVDASSAGKRGRSATAGALVDFLHWIPRSAEIALLTFSDRISLLSGFEADRKPLRAAAERIEGDGGPVLYDALIQSLSMLEAAGQRRQILVLVGGADNGGSRAQFGALEHRMSAGPAVFFAAGRHPRGVGGPPVEPEEPGLFSETLESSVSARWGLTRLAAMTGGLALFSRRPREFGRSLLRIADQLRHHYLLEYYCPLASGAARFHPIEVRLKKGEPASGITLRSRRAYLR